MNQSIQEKLAARAATDEKRLAELNKLAQERPISSWERNEIQEIVKRQKQRNQST